MIISSDMLLMKVAGNILITPVLVRVMPCSGLDLEPDLQAK